MAYNKNMDQVLSNWYNYLLGQQTILNETAKSFPYKNAAWGESKQVDAAVRKLEEIMGVKNE